jgi:putative transcriptional regulator
MSSFGDDLLKSLGEAIAHAEGHGEAIVHAPLEAKQVRKKANLTQKQMAPLMGMSLSGYRKWEQKERRLSGPAATLLQVMDKEPEAFRRAVLADA